MGMNGGGQMRRLILNADDYGLDEEVDAAVLGLASRGIVTAVSAMVLAPRWMEAAARLKQENADCGLHLDLTSRFAAAGSPGAGLTPLVAKAYAGRLAKAKLRVAIETQLDLFEDAIGRAPDFVDGHQHIHQLPGIRTELLHALDRRYGHGARDIGVRICKPRNWRGMKAGVIGSLGAERLARLAVSRGHAINSDFAGVYGFAPDTDLSGCWRRWLATLQGEAPLAMCHVAAPGRSPTDDPIRRARLKEFAWLASGEFEDLRAEFSVTLSRWPATR